VSTEPGAAQNVASATKRKARNHARPQQVKKKCYCPSAVSEPLNKTLKNPTSQQRHVLGSEHNHNFCKTFRSAKRFGQKCVRLSRGDLEKRGYPLCLPIGDFPGK